MKDTVLTPLGKYVLVGASSVGAVGAAATTSALMTAKSLNNQGDGGFMADYIAASIGEVNKQKEKEIKALEDIAAVIKDGNKSLSEAIAATAKNSEAIKGAIEALEKGLNGSLDQIHQDLAETNEDRKQDWQDLKEGLLALIEAIQNSTVAEEINKVGGVLNEIKDSGITLKNQLDENRLERLLTGISEAIKANNVQFELQEIATLLGLIHSSGEYNLEQLTKAIKEGDNKTYAGLTRLDESINRVSTSTLTRLREVAHKLGIGNENGKETNKQLSELLNKLKIMPPQDKNLQDIKNSIEALKEAVTKGPKEIIDYWEHAKTESSSLGWGSLFSS